MRLIGLAGLARSGKDSVANHLVQKHGFHQVAFADPLRDMLEFGLGIDPHYLTEDKESLIPWLGVSARHLLQTLGTEWGRGCIRTSFWIDVLTHSVQMFGDDTDSIVISDIRFNNEANWVRSRGQLWHISRPAEDRDIVNPHSSELGIIPLAGEAIITNDGTLDDLLAHVDRVLA
jgi:hypothetical protein